MKAQILLCIRRLCPFAGFGVVASALAAALWWLDDNYDAALGMLAVMAIWLGVVVISVGVFAFEEWARHSERACLEPELERLRRRVETAEMCLRMQMDRGNLWMERYYDLYKRFRPDLQRRGAGSDGSDEW